MADGYQYNEGDILSKFFNAPPYTQMDEWPYLVDIGAADGVDNSNSKQLLGTWNGLLVEPHPQYFMDLLKLYKSGAHYGLTRNIKLSNYAISDVPGRKRFYLNNQCSSLVYPIGPSIEVEAVTLTDLFMLYGVPRHFEFMSIDCEGHDMAVLRSLDWKTWSIDLVCIEHSMDKQELDHFMKAVDYKLHERTQGNSFYVKKS